MLWPYRSAMVLPPMMAPWGNIGLKTTRALPIQARNARSILPARLWTRCSSEHTVNCALAKLTTSLPSSRAATRPASRGPP